MISFKSGYISFFFFENVFLERIFWIYVDSLEISIKILLYLMNVIKVYLG